MSAMSSPGSITIASLVCSSPKIEQLHCSMPTGRISCIKRDPLAEIVAVESWKDVGWGEETPDMVTRRGFLVAAAVAGASATTLSRKERGDRELKGAGVDRPPFTHW